MYIKYGAKFYSILNTHSLGPCQSPLCPKNWGLAGGGVAPTDGVKWLQHVRGGSRRQRELWSVSSPSLISHHNRCSAAALTFNRLTDHGRVGPAASPTQSYEEAASEQTDIYGRWQFANISIWKRHLGWQWGLPWNWRSQQPAFISSGLFFPPRGAIAWQRKVTECVKTQTRTHSARIRDSNEKVFSKRQKNKLVSFSQNQI